MHAQGTFTVPVFTAIPTPEPDITTGVPVGVAQMTKRFEGEVAGESATLFTSAFDQTNGVGTYVAMESFRGSLRDRAGTFNFAHAATTTGADRDEHFLVIVPGSGTGALAGIEGRGVITVVDGSHHIEFDYTVG